MLRDLLSKSRVKCLINSLASPKGRRETSHMPAHALPWPLFSQVSDYLLYIIYVPWIFTSDGEK